MYLFQSRSFYMRVNLRGGDVGMPQHHLNGSQVRPMIQKVRRERMTQHMRGNRLGNPRPHRTGTQYLPEALPGERVASTRDKDRRGLAILQNLGTSLLQISAHF